MQHPGRRLRLALSVVATLFLVGSALSLWATWIEPNRLLVSHYRIAIDGWPAELGGLRIAFVTDPHLGTVHWPVDELDDIVERTNAIGADVILLGGDYLAGNLAIRKPHPDELVPALSRLRAPLGVYSVLGNHDWWDGYDAIAAAIERAGIVVAEDLAVRIEARGEAFWLVGISDVYEGPADVERALSQVTDGAPAIGLTHTPDIFPDLPSRIALTLAGHTHGGQVYVPFVGRPVVPSRFGERYALGLVEEDGRQLFVSPGIGTSVLPVRFMTPPEISVLTIVAP